MIVAQHIRVRNPDNLTVPDAFPVNLRGSRPTLSTTEFEALVVLRTKHRRSEKRSCVGMIDKALGQRRR